MLQISAVKLPVREISGFPKIRSTISGGWVPIIRIVFILGPSTLGSYPMVMFLKVTEGPASGSSVAYGDTQKAHGPCSQGTYEL